MKTVRTFLIIFTLVITSVNAYAANRLWMNTCPQGTDPGATVQFDVYGEWDFPGELDTLISLQFGLNFNQAVLDCTSATRGALFSGFGISTNDLAGDFRVLLNDGAGVGIAPNSGAVTTVTCTVVGAAGSSTSVDISGGYPEGFVFLVDPDGTPDTGDEYIDEATPSITGECTFTINGGCTPSAEVCDGVDNDCDGQIDEGVKNTYYRDADNDTFGNPNDTTQACTAPQGYVSNNTDCNDSNPAIKPGATETCDGADNNCDGQTDNGIAPIPITCGVGSCQSSGQSTCQGGQMVDSCSPGTPSAETCNGIDDNCDGTADNSIASTPTTCGTGSCASTGQSVCQSGQVVDTCTPGTAQTEGPFGNPTCSDSADNDCDGTADAADSGCVQQCTPSTEVCDGVDNDCDQQIDEGIAAMPTVCGMGACVSTGQSTCQGGQMVDTCTPDSPSTEICNGVDDDCDGTVDEGVKNTYYRDADNDTFGNPNDTNQACTKPQGYVSNNTDCNDGNPSVKPGATESCDGVDNNCDGQIDNGIASTPTTCGIGACASTGQSSCQGGQMVNSCTPGAPQTEGPFGNPTCSDSSDNDCDGSTDAADTGCIEVCTPSAEVCDGVDNDCDGQIDEGVKNAYYRDGDSDTFGNPGDTTQACTPPLGYVSNNTDCNDSNPAIKPGATETCDGVDNNCDGQTDNGIPSTPTTCGTGSCASTGQSVCQSGQMVDTCTPGASQTEGPFGNPTCSDSSDNDCDGTTDATDSGCAQPCTPSTEVCDGVDNDCDGQIDDEIPAAPTTCGVGVCAANGQSTCQGGQMVNSCAPGTPQAEGPFGNPTCSDSSDNDCDGTADAADAGCAQQCTPSAEVCDGVDNDCDGQIDEDIAAVPTSCGVGACASTGQSICQGGQIINTCTPGTASAETCNNIDDNCDGQIDNGIASTPTTCGIGACNSTGQSVCQSGQMVDTCTPGTPQAEGPFGNPTCSDSADNDCDGTADAADSGCAQPCTPSAEVCDGVDNDCDGQIDDEISAAPTTCGAGACQRSGQSTCQAGQVIDSCIPGAPSAETCNNVDDNCDGQIDNGIASTPTTCGIGACNSTGQSVCQSGQMVDTCTPGAPQEEGPFDNATCSDSSDNDCDGSADASDSGCVEVCTPSTEVCDGADNDCDGQIDEDITVVPTTCGVGACASSGQSICQGGQMIDSCSPGVPSAETCNGIDDNCDSTVDNGITPFPSNCGIGACASTGQRVCQDGQMVNTCTPGTPQTEGPWGDPTCSDSIDNDCDGSTDKDAGCLIQPDDMSQWVGKWFVIKENGQMPGQSGITFSAPDSKFMKEKHNGSRKGYMHIWNWDPDNKFLHFDYYAFIKEEGIWDTYPGALQFFSGTDVKFLFLYYHRPDRNQLTAMNGVIEGKMNKGMLQSATIKTFGGYHLEVSNDNTLYSAGEEAIAGKMIDASKVPVPLSVIISR